MSSQPGFSPTAAAHDRILALSRQLASGQESSWAGVQMGPADPILGVSDAWRADPDPRKLNLGVGAYRTEDGKPLVLNVVRKAERRILDDPTQNKEYAPIEGNVEFCKLSRALAFGADCVAIKEKRIATVQALSGTGSLRVGGEFIRQHYPGPKVMYLPNPTWGNHIKIFANSGLTVKTYRYWKAETRGLDYEGMLADLRAAPRGAVVLLHACAHNPTGVDPDEAQWRGILKVVQDLALLPFFDSAYQGFASGSLDKDAAALRMFEAAGVELLLAQSYAKNMGLYGERVGALSVLCSNPDAMLKVESQLKQVIRPMYSSPPRAGAAIACLVLSDPQLFAEWKVELAGMAGRIHSMRTALRDELHSRVPDRDWSFVVKQIGMFSFTGLTKPQCEHLTKQWHVYLTMDGRISMAGLSASKCGYLADAIADALKKA